MSAKGRADLIEKITLDSSNIRIGDAAKLFIGTVAIQKKHTETFDDAKKKLGEECLYKLFNGITCSYVFALYINSAPDEAEMKARMKEVENANSDLAAGWYVCEEEVPKA